MISHNLILVRHRYILMTIYVTICMPLLYGVALSPDKVIYILQYIYHYYEEKQKFLLV